MTSCGQARDSIVDTVRGAASEAERLRLEEHLACCEACRQERGQWALMERLRDLPPQSLSARSKARVLARLVAEPRQRLLPFRARRPIWQPIALSVAAAAALVMLVRGVTPDPGKGGPAVAAFAEGSVLSTEHDGAIEVAGAHIAYKASTRLRLHPARREVELASGEVDVEVVPSGPGRFRVTTARFSVEVLGTRFIVRSDGVRTVHGRVRVLDPEGRQLAVVSGGESWTFPVAAGAAPPLIPPGPQATPAIGSSVANAGVLATKEFVAPLVNQAARGAVPVIVNPVDKSGIGQANLPPSRQPAGPRAAPGPGDDVNQLVKSGAATGRAPNGGQPSATASAWLELANSEQSVGNYAACREHLKLALASAPTLRERAKAELFAAEMLLGEKRYAEAVGAFRRVASRYGNYPEAELAAYTVAQLLFERSRDAAGTVGRRDADAALRSYLAVYPRGRFLREIREDLVEMDSSAP